MNSKRNPKPSIARKKRRVNAIIQCPGGLQNPHHFCYMNSCLQLLFSCEDFMEKMLNITISFPEQFPKSSIIFNFTEMYNLWKHDNVTLRFSKKFKRLIGKENPIFANDEQEDVQEFMAFFLNSIEKEIMEFNEQNNIHIPNHIKDFFKFDTSIELKCLKCSESSVHMENTNMLSLPFPKCICFSDMRKALKMYFLSEEIVRICPYCTHDRAKSTFSIKTFPKYLFLHLKRFFYDRNFVPHKHKQFFNTNENLYLKRYHKSVNNQASVTEGTSSPTNCTAAESGATNIQSDFKLKGIINHHGSTIQRGHYTASCYKQEDRWYRINDKKIVEASQEDTFAESKNGGYLYLYCCDSTI